VLNNSTTTTEHWTIPSFDGFKTSAVQVRRSPYRMRVLAEGVASAKQRQDDDRSPGNPFLCSNLNTATTDAAMNISGREFG
jgi:hypothetical protein